MTFALKSMAAAAAFVAAGAVTVTLDQTYMDLTASGSGHQSHH